MLPGLRISSVGAFLAAAAAAASPAQAQECVAPPGRSAIEQYCESLPGPGGERSTRLGDAAGGVGRPGGSGVLFGQGADGPGNQGLGATEAPGGAPRPDDGAADPGPDGPGAAGNDDFGGIERGATEAREARAVLGAASTPGQSPFAALGSALGSTGGGLGVVIAVLAGTLVTLAVARRRTQRR